MSSHHFVTVCVVCVLCAAHTPCSAHTDASSRQEAKNLWSSSDQMKLLSSGRVESLREDIADKSKSSNFPSPDAVEIVKEGKKPVQRKYSHSYSSEKALRKIASNNAKVEEINENREILERLGHIDDEMHREKLSKDAEKNVDSQSRNRRGTEINDKYFMKKLFDAYGDGTNLSIEGFERLLKKLGLFRLVENIEKFDQVQDNRGNGQKDGKTDSQGILDPNSISSQQKCLNSRELISTVSRETSETSISKSNKTQTSESPKFLPDWLFTRVCPVLIYHLAGNTTSEREGCIIPLNAYSPTMAGVVDDILNNNNNNNNIEDEESSRNMVQVWVYSTISIVIISLCGLLGVLVIPVMGKSYYHQLLQFLVALAIGTLCGDALIHLLPHAMMAPHSHSHEISTVLKSEMDIEAEHNLNMWKGLTAMIGLITFFFTEKALAMIAEWRKHRQRKNKLPSRVRVMRETDGANTNNVGEKLCKHKYSSYPYCYGEITTETRDNHHDRNQHNNHERVSTTIDEEKPLTSNCNSVSKIMIPKDENMDNAKSPLNNKLSEAIEDWRIDGDGPLKNNLTEKAISNNHKNHKHNHDGAGEGGDISLKETESYTVIIREHENKHHGHSHSHGHVHAAPDSMSSVAWMVVMGDGLHNFTDGMAIGAAFAANIAGGFSTAIAVFCHELPHELGDFAVLLKAGMSWRQALFYNLLSSVLCLFGMIIGVLLGATPAATSWIFAAAAGMFIYIALVDMIPELSSSHSEEGGSRWECVLQALGLVSGLGIMLIIALYEHDLKHIFSN